MFDALSALLIDALPGLAAGNRLSLEGFSLTPVDGMHQLGLERLEAASLRFALGPFALEIGRISLHQLAGRVRLDEGRPRLLGLEAARGELAVAKLHGPVDLPQAPGRDAPARPAGPWRLAPLAAVNGTLRAEIVDAHLLFDADVTVPVREGQVDFDAATVEHVGPDSRLGASRFGIYVDAPNGRSYLYQFPTAPVAGVAFERRGAWLGGVTDRGRLQLRPFVEGMLRQGAIARGLCFTDQARLLFDRTAVSGELRLGDGAFAAPGVQGELAGRAESRNAVTLQSEAVGRALTAAMAALLVRRLTANWGGMQLACDEVAGACTLRLVREDAQLRFAFELPDILVSGLRLDAPGPAR